MENYNVEEAVGKDYDSNLMKRLLLFAKPFAFHISIVVFLMLITTVLDLTRPYLIKNVIDNDISGYKKPYTIFASPPGEPTHRIRAAKIGNIYAAEGSIKGGIPSAIIYKENSYYLVNSATSRSYKLTGRELKILRRSDSRGILNTVLFLLLISISMFALNYLQVYLLSYAGQKIVYNIRQKLFEHIEGLSLAFFDKNPVGRLVTRITNDVDALNEMYTGVLVYLFKDFFLIAGVLVAMFLLNYKLGLVTLCVTPFLVIAALVFKKYDRDAYRDVRVKIARINSSLSENITGMKTVQIYAKEGKKFREFNEINQSYLKAALKQLKVYAVFRPTIDFLSSITMAAILWFGGIKILHKEIELGLLYAFVNYLQYFFQPIYDLTEKYDILQSAMASSERIFMLLDTTETEAEAKQDIVQEIQPLSFKGEIEFKNVWFAYNNEEWVLRDVSFKISPGEKIAFVGATGAGKTSIISLISRFYEIQRGEILIDGRNIKDIPRDILRSNIATVLQEVFLFTGDINMNVRLNNRSISDEDIVKACKYVNADRFIEKLKNGYNSVVNERGSIFSQGERQLLAFARAIAFNPPILVLDEATSNIDTETESLIQDALKKISQNRTTIVVAHRLSTIKNSDKIIVLHKGKIRETGTHESLLENKGLYYDLYQLQYKDLE